MYSSYWVFSVLNAFQAAIVLRRISILDGQCMHLDIDGEKGEKKSCSGPANNLYETYLGIHMGPIWGVQLGLIWAPYGLAPVNKI